jgi:S-adenosylmethionine/arginine decarboxylase-like enzyme
MENMMAEFWGWHLLLDIRACDIESIKSEDNHRAFLKALVERIDMVAYGEPVLSHFATHDPEKAGYSVVQLIETSNITGHFVDKNGNAYIDVFSCKPFQPDDVVAVVNEFYKPENVTVQFLYRLA